MAIAQIEQAIATSKASQGTARSLESYGRGVSISNGGVFGSMLSTPIINAAKRHLGVHATKNARGGERADVIRPMNYLPLVRPSHHRRARGGPLAGGDEGSARGSGSPDSRRLGDFVARKKRLTPAAVAIRILLFVAGSLLVGFLTVFLDAELGVYLPRHFSVSIAVGSRFACTLWLWASSIRRCS